MYSSKHLKKVFTTTPLYSSTLCFLVVLLITMAMFCPNLSRIVYQSNAKSLATLNKIDINDKNDSKMDSNGNYEIIGADPQIVFDNINLYVGSIVINAKQNFESNTKVQVYIDDGNGYSEADSIKVGTFLDENRIVIPVLNKNIKSLRLDFSKEFQFDNITLYEQSMTGNVHKISNHGINYFFAVIIALAVAIIFYLVDKKIQYSNKIIKIIKRNIIKILLFIVIAAALFLISILTELLLQKVLPGYTTFNREFSKYRLTVIFGILILIESAVFLKNSMAEKPERFFISAVIIIGSVFIIASPFGHNSWDIDTHYEWAVNASFATTKNYTDTDTDFFYNKELSVTKHDLDSHNNGKIMANQKDMYVTSQKEEGKTTIAHLPSGIMIALGRFFGASFTVKFMMGEFGILLTYAIVMFLAMKKLKTGKMVLAIFALFPTNLFLATNYSYDYWVTCFTVLGMAYFLSESVEPDKPISTKDTIIMFSAFAIGCIPKLIYIALLIIPLFLRKNCFDKKAKQRFYTIGILVVLVTLFLCFLTSVDKATGTGDLRGGSTISPMDQIQYILSKPLEYANTLIKFLLSYLSISSMSEYISVYAYLGKSSSYIIVLALMLLAVMTDKNEFDLKLPRKKMTIVNLIIYFGTAALVATSLFIIFTPVGARKIEGCQPRYLLPLIYPVVSVIGSPFIVNKIKRSYYNGTILMIMSFVLFYDFSSVFLGGRIV